ncbi:hypothetical protein BN2476_390036 [Paraburkholderia piptadeniae]|uniref:Uncharacterized protein n=1 Tax=Paraburkholderia piptadeniae TaxID=1701573 RepID=A0A1N7SAH7_9BURK|nr:hypothetical protein BN2476_390036 [Paraburkholderia piptadeniae]
MPRATGRYSGCYVRVTVSGDLPTIRWRVARTFTPVVQAPVGLTIVSQSRQHGSTAARTGRHRLAAMAPPGLTVCRADPLWPSDGPFGG